MLRNTAKTLTPYFFALIFSLSGLGQAIAQTVIMQDGVTVSECSGIFYDTGGPSANYSNNEIMTMTICPTGGPGSGPNTSIEFTFWTVQGGTVDQLSIYDGTNTSSLITVGDGDNTLLGMSFVSTDPSGCLTFQWTSNATVTAPGWAAMITTGPNAGTDGSTTVCTDVPPFSLFGVLGGSPDAGGSWTDPSSAAHSGNYDPTNDAPGDYTYTVSGPSPCADSSAIVTVSEVDAPDPGISNSATFCDTDAQVALIDLLGGTPDGGGSWTDPNSTPHGPNFNPFNDIDGIYTYTVSGTAPCTDGIATVNIVVNQQPDAGNNGNITVCDDDASFLLFNELNGTPDGSGSWTAPGNIPHSGTFIPGTDGAGIYTYTVLGTAPCSNATATVSVSVNNAPDAGINSSVLVCSDDPSVSLVTILGGTPDLSGTWIDPLTNPHSGTFVPGSDPTGIYTYTVTGMAPCSDDVATVLVSENIAPDAGNDGTITVCSIDANFDLFDELLGVPDPAGSWTDPNGDPHGSTFIPATSLPGIYTYKVVGVAPCSNDQATVTVSVNIAPDAGISGSTTLCSIDAPISLTSILGGFPDGGGTWVDPALNLHSDQFDPSTDASGIYTYTVNGLAPCPNAIATVTMNVNIAPEAGTNGNITLCSTDGQVDLYTLLGGTPDPGGSWSAPGNVPHSGTYDPVNDAPGNYTYTVAGLAPCTDATSVVDVTEVQAPNAGVNSTIAVCSDDATLTLVDQLNGTPDGGGTWIAPDLSPHGGTFDPSNDLPGSYVYTVPGTVPCAAASATVLINVNTAPVAGNDAVEVFCSTDGQVQLIDLVGGTPDLNGQWYDPNDAPIAGTLNPGISMSGVYTYVVNGTAPCENDSAFVDATINVAPIAGTNGSITVCDTDVNVNLFLLLGGSPDGGGAWTDPNSDSHNGIYNPGNDEPGIYIYTVAGIAPCTDALSSVNVTENIQPVAGTNGSIAICSDAAPFILLDQLNGSPDVGGVWTDPNSIVHSGILDPLVDITGNYTYSLSAVAPCSDVSAAVAVTINAAPNPGIDGGLTTCNDVASVDLFTGLGGTPEAGGTWNDDDGTGALSGQLFIPLGFPAGDYNFTYTVTGSGNCPDASATVTVTIVGSLNAGTNGASNACDTETSVDLFAELNGGPQSGGVWFDDDATGALTGQFFDATMVSAGSYDFTYKLVGSIGCASDSANVTVTVTEGPDAGVDGSIEVCSNGGQFDLFDELNGTPQTGGVWTDQNGDPHSANYVPSSDDPGDYTYTLGGTGPCADATAVVSVSEVLAPNSGQSTNTTVCSTGGSVDLFPLLIGAEATGTWTDPNGDPHSGTFLPSVDPAGAYLYRVTGTNPCADGISSVTVIINSAPDPGTSGSQTVCSDDAPFLLISFLGGTPDLNGSWTDPNGDLHIGIFDPDVALEGTYEYTVPGVSPCADASATVTIFINDAPDAGINSSVNICSNAAQINLFTILSGTPDPSGTWTDPNGDPHTGNYNPALDLQGNYSYTVGGILPCTDAIAIVNVSVENAPDPGSSNTQIICDDELAFALIDVLNGSPDLNGTWRDPLGDPHNGIFIPTVSMPGVYFYSVPGVVACSTDSASVTISVNTAPDAGTNGSTTVCSTDGSLLLFGLLNGSPDVGGSWLDPVDAPHSGVFNPSSSADGQYRYVVNGIAPCVSDTSIVTVVVNQAPNAGNNGTITVCDIDIAFPLIDQIGGSPDLIGSWMAPGNVVHSGIFVPGSDQPGIYTYTVNGVAPCAPAVSTVNVIVNPNPEPGTDGLITVCSSDAQFDMIDELGGTPDLTGFWLDPNLSPHSGTYIPGTDISGDYTYTVNGIFPCVDISSVVTVNEVVAANAGANNGFPVCTDQPEFDMIDQLLGTPDATGSWTDPNILPHDGSFEPGVDITGPYVYTVLGSGPCPDATATLQITNVIAPNAGIGGGLTTCENDPGIDLFVGLSGTPDLNGTWNDDDNTGQLIGSIFDATGLSVGNYEFTYLVLGNGPCADASTTVIVTLTLQLDAGVDGSITSCDNETAIDLFSGLGGTPQPGGSWEDVNGSGGLTGGLLDATVSGTGTFDYRYVLAGSGACISDTAFVEVDVLSGPNAGTNTNVAKCTNAPIFDMFNELGGSPDTGGIWLDPTLQSHTGNFDPSVDVAGAYTYIALAAGPCVNDSSIVTVSLTTAPDAGISAVYSTCADDDPINLIGILGGTPETTGSWLDPNLVSHNGTFDPASDDEGVYIYTVPGTSPCANAISTVTMTVDQEANAGGAGSILKCGSDAPFDMIIVLSGIPDAGGSWLDPALAPHADEFTPGTDPSGSYTYVVTGAGACENDTTVAIIDQVAAPNAGIGSAIDTCETTTSLDLTIGLSGNFDLGGSWLDVNLTGALAGSIFDPSIPGTGTYLFDYIVSGVSPCDDDTAKVTVNVFAGPDAGIADSVDVCSTNCAYDLFDALLGSPDPGGIWIDDAGTGALSDSILNACILLPGDHPFTYSVSSPGCDTAFSHVLITIIEGSDPGTDGSLILCSTDSPTDLFPSLGGTPDINGNWSDPSGNPHDGIFDPAVDLPGEYSYDVPGSAVCTDSSAIVTVTLNQPPNAGTDGTMEECDTSAPLDLFIALNGNPDTGGTFNDDDNTGALSGNLFDPSIAGAGDYNFTYTVTVSGCGSASSVATVTVHGSVIISNVNEVCIEEDRMYTVSFVLTGGDGTTYVVGGVGGTLTQGVPYVFTSDPIPHGDPYSITAMDQYECNEALITGVSPCEFESDVFIPQSFSPNGDNINDLFLIPGIEAFPNNTLVIFNRWGNEVFKASGYDNVNNTWDGTSQDAAFGDQLPKGTYFYILDLGNGKEAKSGSIYLNR